VRSTGRSANSDRARVSIVIPTHNRAGLLRLAIDSALAQTYPQVELIVVDDGSTDGTAAVVAQYGERVTYLRQANRDVAAARNTGVRAASGDYLAFLDDDDLILPDKIERQMQVLAARPEVALVHCGYDYVDERGRRVGRTALLPEGQVLKQLLCRNFIWVGGPLIRRRALDQVGLFDESIPAISADWELWLRIAMAGLPFACVQEPLGAYRIHSDSMLADVARLERATVAILHKVFSRPDHLPAGVAAMEGQAYARWRLWLGCRYCAAGQWGDGRRNLAQALALHPRILNDERELAWTLYNEALDLRVGDPSQFIDGVLDHLPPAADGLRRRRPGLLGLVQAGLALREYGLGNVEDGRAQLAAAIDRYPMLLRHPEDFARALYERAMHLPGPPHRYVRTVLHNLPPEAQALAHVRNRVLSDVDVACAFEDYFNGRPARAARRILRALRRRPSWLKNRGVVSILAKSLPRALVGDGTTY